MGTEDVELGRRSYDEGTWYALAGYVALSIVVVGYACYAVASSGLPPTSETLYHLATVFWWHGLFGTLAFARLFTDAMYVRERHGPWTPAWWYYVFGPLVAVTAVYFVAFDTLQDRRVHLLTGFVWGLATLAAHALYLYRRHRHLGEP